MTPDQDYELFEFASNDFLDDELINKGLCIARDVISALLKSLRQSPIKVCVYGYVDLEINAMVIKSKEVYKITISTGALTQFFCWYKMWFQAPAMKELFQSEKDDADTLVEKLYKFSIEYIAAHELFHALNGHCDIPKNEEHFVSEKLDISSEEQHLFNQILEFDADRAAVRSCIYLLLRGNSTYADLFREVGLLSFALYNVFLVFQNESKIGFDNYIKHVFYFKDHPYDGIRFSYSFAFIVDALLQISLQQVVIDYFIFPTTERFITFEKRVLGVPEVKNCLFSASFTYRGAQHIMNLNNAWNDVAERLRPYAHIPLATGEHIHAMRIFLDDSGKFYNASEGNTQTDDSIE